MPATKQLSTSPLRLPPDLKEWAKNQAKNEGMSLNAWIVKMIEKRREAATPPPASEKTRTQLG